MSRARRSVIQITSQIACCAVAVLLMAGCTGSTSSTKMPTPTPTPTPTSGNNVQSISVNTGPTVAVNIASVDLAFTSVTVCTPGSTSQCQTIDGVLVDTGSYGLRVLSSALTISLPQQKDSSGNPIGECTQFVDGEAWGPVASADVTVSGEKASGIPVQVVGSSNFPQVPTTCSNLGPVESDLSTLGANGILGVGAFVEDCGDACTVSGSQNAGFYYSCPSSGCAVTTEALAQQVSNPVAFFASDNNGVIVELPAATGSEASLSGSLIFGIGTQSNNALSNATVYTLDPSTGNITTTFKGQTFTNAAFLDTGSNAIYFLDAATTGMPTCPSPLTFWYCPSSTQNFSATNQGANGATTTINFSVGNADTLTANTNNAVEPDLAGPNANTFDWGLPFFFGRNVYVAIAGRSTSGGPGPYWAY